MTPLLTLTLTGCVRPMAGSEQVAVTTGRASAVRLHHLHYAVAEPAAAMNEAAEALEGTRVLLQGLGVGVRVGDQYLLFDRIDPAAPVDRLARAPRDAFTSAAAWLAALGVRAPDAFTAEPLAAAVAGGSLDHIAFVTENLAAARAALAAGGAEAIRESAGAVMYRTADGVTVELVGPTDLEDAFWCPMHPDVRSARAGACPICSMTLVPIPAPQIGEYRMDVTVTPGPGARGMSGLRLLIRDPESGAPVSSFATVHERPLHLFIVGRTLDYFAHVHPEPAGEGTFDLKHDVPPGEYMLIADFLPQGGVSQTVQRAVVTAGYTRPLMAPVPDPPVGPPEQILDGVRIRLDTGELAPRKEAGLRFTISDEATGEPVTDLEPFLGAPAHMLIVRADLTEVIHGHPDRQDVPSVIEFDPLMPTAGIYKLWLQVQRKGKVLTAPFVIRVAER